MTNDVQVLLNIMEQVKGLLSVPWWKDFTFWLFLALAILGLIFSVLAFVEAKHAKIEAEHAKRAATEAGRTVKIQTIVIDLAEIPQRLDRLRPGITFNEARDALNEITRRVRRAVSQFKKDTDLNDTIVSLTGALSVAQTSLQAVRPENPSDEKTATYAVYNAIEADFAIINGFVADLLGLLEKKTLNLGDANVKT